VLGTLHASRGVDVVPVVFAGDSDRLYLPVDTLKPKRSTLLQRIANIEADPRCVLLVEHYSENWDELWWVRVHGSASVCTSDDLENARSVLTARHPRYAQPGSIVTALVLVPEITSGCQARDPEQLRPR
jgi:PPOX class probable F420-dependent enzyme